MNEETSPDAADDTPETATSSAGHASFRSDQYYIRRQFFKVLGAAFHIYDGDGNLAFYSKQKAFKLKEDIRVYGDEAMNEEVLTIKARGVIDLGMTYDVIDSASGTAMGAMKRKGLKSIIRDEWAILDVDDNEIGIIQEESVALALLRRFGPVGQVLAPQMFDGRIGETSVLQFKQGRNPFVQKIALDYGMDTGNVLDRRMGIAAAVLICAIEGHQK